MSSVGDAQAETHSALEAAIAGNILPEQVQAQAAKLKERLENVTRVTVLGKSGSGKSALLNILAGQQVLPPGLSMCTFQLSYGEEEKATLTLRDGSQLVKDGPLEMSRLAAMSPAFVVIEAPIPALRKITLTEVVTPEDRVQQIRALKWAMKQTDIAIWCTTEFDASEQALWENVPDAIKDHAILVLSQADRLGAERENRLEDLRRAARDEFAHIMSVSAEEATAARANPDGIDKAMLRASGAMALISTILRHIENGRQYAADQAEILLHRYKTDAVQPKPVKRVAKPKDAKPKAKKPVPVVEEAVAEPELAAAPPEPVEEPAPTPLPETSEQELAAEAQLPDDEAEVEGDAVAESVEEAEAEPEQNAVQKAKSKLRERIRARAKTRAAMEASAEAEEPKKAVLPKTLDAEEGDPIPFEEFVFNRKAKGQQKQPEPSAAAKSETLEMADEMELVSKDDLADAEDAETLQSLADALRVAALRLTEAGQEIQALDAKDPDEILEQSARVISWLTEHFAQDQWPMGPELDRCREMAQDAEDLVQLMRIEGSETGAVDAITMMLQLKRGYQAELAA